MVKSKTASKNKRGEKGVTNREKTTSSYVSKAPGTQASLMDANNGNGAVSSENEKLYSLTSSKTASKTVQSRPDSNKLRASRPFHKRVQASLLSSGSEEPNYRGFINLAMIALLAMTIRLIIENSIKYGFLLSFDFKNIDFHSWLPDLFAIVFNIIVFPQVAWLIEICTFTAGSIKPSSSSQTKSGSKNHTTKAKGGSEKIAQASKPDQKNDTAVIRKWYQVVSPRYTVALQLLNVAILFFGSMAIIHFSAASILPGVSLAFITLVLTMKLISYAHVSYDVRRTGNEIAVLPNGALVVYDPDMPPTLESLDGTCHHKTAHPLPSNDQLRNIRELSDFSDTTDTSEVSDNDSPSIARKNLLKTPTGVTSEESISPVALEETRKKNEKKTSSLSSNSRSSASTQHIGDNGPSEQKHVTWNEEVEYSKSSSKSKARAKKGGDHSPSDSDAENDNGSLGEETMDEAGAPLTHLSGYTRLSRSLQTQLSTSMRKLQSVLQKHTVETKDRLADLFPIFRVTDSRVCVLSRLAVKAADERRTLSFPSAAQVAISNGEFEFKYRVTPYVPDLKQLHYFLCSPTLVFQLSYPRSDSISLFFILRRLVEIVVCFAIILLTIGQYVTPTLVNSIGYFENKDLLMILERILKLCIPNTILWLAMFYGFFHSYLNLVAEILRFGDRMFYRDWWNSGDLGVYWRLWNRPVHDWLVKHVYSIVIRRGWNSKLAQIFVFFISALLHEVLISVPCHMLCAHAFFGMFMQVPIISITKWIHQKTGNAVFGNVTFWCFFCIFGQPLLILLYGYEYISKYQVVLSSGL